jgi:hypothetical protein
MNPHVGSNLRNLEIPKESYAENVETKIIIGYRPLNSTNVKNVKPGQP